MCSTHKIVPRTTHKIAGNQPQYTAIHGPIIGAAPAIDGEVMTKKNMFIGWNIINTILKFMSRCFWLLILYTLEDKNRL